MNCFMKNQRNESVMENIKRSMIFFTSGIEDAVLQTGIMQSFKMKGPKRLIKYVLARDSEKKSASEMVKSLNVLQAIQWIQESWKDVTNATIKDCFEKCGIVKRHEELMGVEDEDDLEFAALVRVHTRYSCFGVCQFRR